MFKKKQNISQFFFIRGFARSGTNWLNNILNLHPDVYATGEFNFHHILKEIENVKNREWGLFKEEQKLGKILSQDFEESVKKILTHTIKNETGTTFPRIGDRTPNPLHPFPVQDAYYFWIVRDVRDVIVSLTYHQFKLDFKESRLTPFPEMIEKKEMFKKDSEYFKNHPTELVSQDWALAVADRWNKQCQNNLKAIKNAHASKKIYQIRYEDLHADLETERMKLYSFLNVEPTRANPVPELVQPGFKKERPNHHYRSGKTGAWQKHISPELDQKIQNIAQDSMIFLGYVS